MKKLLITLCSILPLCACHQSRTASSASSEEDVAQAVSQLIKGIQEADETTLRDITAEELVYGHSSGKVQNKEEFVAEIISGEPLDYVSIACTDQTIKVVGETAIVRHVFTAETLSADTPGTLRIGNVLIWQLQKNQWKLLARQAYRV